VSAPPIELLRCPDCGGALEPGGGPEAFATCPRCLRQFQRIGGVFELVPAGTSKLTDETVKQFGDSWKIHSHLADYQEQQFKDWIAPLAPADFKGKTVIEAGCGKGRHSRIVGNWGPAHLLSMDLSDAVVLAAGNTADQPPVHCLRANLLKLPLASGFADLAFCVGVLHHLENPEAGLLQLWERLNPGGTLCLWVYGREGNGWIIHILDPIRKNITSRIPTRLLRIFAWPLSVFLFILLKLLYAPLTGRGRHYRFWLPYSAYLGYISKYPFREIEHIVLDHLCPPLACYLSRQTLEGWFAKLPGAQTEYRWHNRNSWNVTARKAAAAGGS
jgi:SAM-dependent methyltransferase